jgi:hypothetical protein
MTQRRIPWLAAIVGLLLCAPAAARVITVGPSGEFKKPSQAAKAAFDGDTIEIEAGDYKGDVAVWPQNGLTIRGVGGMAMLRSGGKVAQGKAIWVINGDDVLIENIGFLGARASDRNGAGLRHQGGTLTVRGSLFRNNENGILTNNKRHQRLIVEGSEFAKNGASKNGQTHAIYAGSIGELIVRASYFHGTTIGHHIKSRANTTSIVCNYLVDGEEGSASFEVDLPAAGNALIMGNIMRKGRQADNTGMIAYGNEGPKNKGRNLTIINNTLITDMDQGTFVRVNKKVDTVAAHISNNILVGKAVIAERADATEPNLHAESLGGGDGVLDALKAAAGLVADPKFVDAANGDYRLAESSPAIDAGLDNTAIDGELVVPDCEYVHPASERPRPEVGAIDLGAYEYVP